jgi:glycyl-tRNA synthetase beta chain
MFESVRARAPGSPLDFHQRLDAVRSFLELDESESLAIANKRIANILRSADATADGVDPSLFQADEERALSDAVNAVLPRHQADLEERNYTSVLHNLAALREPIDAFFDSVMVMAEDEAQRNNRLAQLTRLRELFLDVADLSCIPS